MLSPKIGLTINWLCPPVYLRCKVVRHMKLFSAKGALVVPIWRSAHFWPVLCSDGVHWSNFIHDWVILPNFPNLFIACKAKNSIFGYKPLSFVSVALRIDVSALFCASSANFSPISPSFVPKAALASSTASVTALRALN